MEDHRSFRQRVRDRDCPAAVSLLRKKFRAVSLEDLTRLARGKTYLSGVILSVKASKQEAKTISYTRRDASHATYHRLVLLR